MTNPIPTPPSPRSLLRSTLWAAVVAGVILVTIVLPAEYGIDPSGLGSALGLKEMGDTKMRLAREAAAHDQEQAEADGEPADPPPTPPSAPADSAASKTDVVEAVLLPNQGTEIKLAMRKDARVAYVWSVTDGVVNFDTHADSPTIKYHGYSKGTAATGDSGAIVAAFDGHHGWFWRNRTRDTVTITLRTTGAYLELKRLP